MFGNRVLDSGWRVFVCGIVVEFQDVGYTLVFVCLMIEGDVLCGSGLFFLVVLLTVLAFVLIGFSGVVLLVDLCDLVKLCSCVENEWVG